MELLGLANCDTCRTARKALEQAGYTVSFHDVRDEPLPRHEIAALVHELGDALINRRSTTWRWLAEEERKEADIDLLVRHPALMKRPVIRAGGKVYLGWTAETRSALGLA